MVPPTGSGVIFPPPSFRVCLSSPLWATLAVYLYGDRSNLLQRRNYSCLCRDSKVSNTVKINVEGLVGLLNCFVTKLPLLRVLGTLNGLVNTPLWHNIYSLNDASFPSPNINYLAPQRITYFSEALPSWWGLDIWALWLGKLFDYCSDVDIRLPWIHILSENFAYPRGWPLLNLVFWFISSLKV